MRGTGLKALLALVAAFVLLPSAAVAPAAPPLAHAHPQSPFGSSFRAVCRAVPPGRARCLADVLTVGGAVNGATARPLLTVGPLGYGPADLQDAYGIVSEAATSGATQTVALIDAYDDPSAEADLSKYRSEYGLPACTTAGGCFRKVNQRGGSSYPPANAEWESEIALDLDTVSAICPKCHILLVEADTSFSFDLAESANEAAVLGATQISNSYGGPEFASETSLDAYYNHAGVAVTASSGDSGYGVQYPAASRYVTAVGGTSLTQAPAQPRGWAESAWAGAGSGCSEYEPKPSWQLDLGCSNRTVADVAAVADPATGAAVYSNEAWAVYGGTSLASPIVAAYDALIGSTAASAQYPYTHLGSYFDVTSGSNGLCGGSYLCKAVAGYDGPTGLGSPHGAGLNRAPTVGTGSASGVGVSSATLNGTVNPNGSSTEYRFEYGTSNKYGTATSVTAAGSESVAHAVSASLSSLSASTTYHFRIVATNGFGAHAGNDNIFTTGAGPGAPTNTVKPHSVGLPIVGAALTSSTGTWTGLPDEYGYQWYRCMPVSKGCFPSAIAGATASTYTVSAADLGGSVYAYVSAHNANGWSASEQPDNAIGPIRAPVPANTAAPHVTGAAQVGSILSVTTGAWSAEPSGYEYQWWHCMFISGGGCLPSAIGGASASAYTAAAGDVGGIVWATVRARNANGSSSFVNSDNVVGPVTGIGMPANTGRPHVSGEAVVGAVLSASPGTWTGSPDAYEYQWLDCMPVGGGGCVPSHVGGNSASYAILGGDLGGALYVAVRAHNGGGWSSFVVSDNALGPIAAPRGGQAAVLAPSIARLAIRPSAFRAARRGASVAVATGARVTLTLSRAAYLIFTVERAASGRRVGRRCVAPGSRNRRRPSCTRYLALKGSFRYPARGLAAAGARGFRFTGRLAGRALAPGGYRLVAVAVGATGARSSASRSAFRIVR